MRLARPIVSRSFRRAQRGVVLMVALIVLVGLTLAGLSMIRSADTGVVVAGNLSFRQAAAPALDAGVEAAIAGLPADLNFGAIAIPGKYFPFPLPIDPATRLPSGFSWPSAHTVSGGAVPSGYTVRYIVERLCSDTGTPLTDPYDAEKRCSVEKGGDMGSSKFGPDDLGQIRKIHYQITVQVVGPRNTETYAQSVVSR